MKQRPNKIFLVWNPEDEDGDSGYYAMYDSIQEAVDSEQNEIVEIFEAETKLLGKFKQRISYEKVKK